MPQFCALYGKPLLSKISGPLREQLPLGGSRFDVDFNAGLVDEGNGLFGSLAVPDTTSSG